MHALRDPRRLVLTAIALGASLLSPGSVLADCAPAPGLEAAISSSDLAFVGTVTSVQHEGRSARVEVAEIWRGGELPSEVTVSGGRDPTQPMEDDRTFEAGTTYLFFPTIQDGRMVDGICSATTAWTDSMAALRTVDAHAPAPGAPPPSGPFAALGELGPAIATAALLGGLALAIAVVVGRRRDT
jgi:hypothetical protein